MITQYLDTTIEIDDLCPIYRGSFGLNGELVETDIIEKVVNILKEIESPVMLDVGACTGSYAMLDKLVDVQIYSFEPVDRTFGVLRKNIKANNSKTKCFNLAVSDYCGTGTLKTVPHDGAVALSLVDGMPSFTRKDTINSGIEVITIDQFCNDYNLIPDFIKIDVEGGELMALRGAKETIDKYHPVILCEYCQENANQFGYNIGDVTNFVHEKYTINHLDGNILCQPK